MTRGARITGRVLAKALRAFLAHQRKLSQERKIDASKPPQGKQTVKQLAKQNAGLTNIEITQKNIKSFDRIARKYGVDYALKRDKSVSPPKWLVFFKARDADALTAAFKEFSAKTVTRSSPPKPSLLAALKKARELIASLATDKIKNKDRGIEL